MRRLTLVLAMAAAVALFTAACGEKTEDNSTPTAKEGPAEEPKAKEDKAEKPATETAKPAEPETPAKPEKSAETEKPAEAAKPAGYDLVKPLGDAARYLPDGLVAIAVLDFTAVDNLASAFLPGGVLLKLSEEKQKALEEKLAEYHKKKLGFAVRQVDSAVLFVTATADIGVLFKGVVELADGGPKPEIVAGHRLIQLGQPRDISLFIIEDFGVGMFVPKSTPLENYLTISADRKDSPERYAAFKKDLGSRTDAWMMTVIDFTNPLIAMVWPADAPVARPDRGIISFKNTGLAVDLEAGEKCLDDIDKWVNLGKEQASIAIAQAKAKLDDLEVAEGTAVILADALFEDAFNALAPKRSEGKMTLDMDLELWGAMPIIGILASVAVPAFIKYQRRAKTTEAIDQLDKIVKGSVVYYSTPRVDTSGNRVPAQFPPSVPATPAPGTCCGSLGGPDADGDDRCDVNAAAWANDTWFALHFHMSDQHHYTYEYKSSGTGENATFEAIAYGDLDCDGVKSTFARTGKGKKSEYGGFEVDLDLHMFKENETE